VLAGRARRAGARPLLHHLLPLLLQLLVLLLLHQQLRLATPTLLRASQRG
jgi:hypothetical protein